MPTRTVQISVFGIYGIKTGQHLVSDSALMVIHTRGKRWSQRPSSEMVGILILILN